MTQHDKMPTRTSVSMHNDDLYRLYWLLTLAYGFFFLPMHSAFQVAETGLVLLFFWSLCARGNLRLTLRKDPFFRMLLVLLVYLLGTSAWHKFTLPEGMNTSLRFTRYYLKPMMILAIALGLAIGSARRSWALLLASLSGLILYLALYTGVSEWVNAWNGTRTDFGIHNAQHTGLLFGSCLLVSLFFAPRSILAGRKKTRLAIIVGLMILILFALFGTLASQTRAVWLGLFAAFVSTCLLAPYAQLHSQQRQFNRRRSLHLGVGVACVAVILALGFANFNADTIIESRLASENITIEKLKAAASLEHSPEFTSISIRVASWSAGLTWFSERPWLGWGGGTTSELIDRSDFFSDAFKSSFGHLHNSYLETLVSHGALGAVIILSLMVWLIISTFKAFNQGRMPVDVFLFACAFFVYWLVINTFESYILYASGHYSIAIIGGFIYSFYLRGQMND